jgi:hypothetical protein
LRLRPRQRLLQGLAHDETQHIGLAAPMAIRIPISCVRCTTEYDITP